MMSGGTEPAQLCSRSCNEAAVIYLQIRSARPAPALTWSSKQSWLCSMLAQGSLPLQPACGRRQTAVERRTGSTRRPSRQHQAVAALPPSSPPPPPRPPGDLQLRARKMHQAPAAHMSKHGSSYHFIAPLATAAAAAVSLLLGLVWPWQAAAAAAQQHQQQRQPSATAAAVAAAEGNLHWQPLSSSSGRHIGASPRSSPSARAYASVAIGGGSPGFKTERVSDIAGFKLAGLLQQILSAHIVLKVGPSSYCRGGTGTVHTQPVLKGPGIFCITAALPADWWVAPSPTLALQIVTLALVGAPVIYAWGCLYAAITGAPVSLGVFKVVSVASACPVVGRTPQSVAWIPACLPVCWQPALLTF